MRREREMPWERQMRQQNQILKAESEGRVADSLDVRIALIQKVERGEMTLAELQAELKRIQRNAKKNGKITRTQAYRGY